MPRRARRKNGTIIINPCQSYACGDSVEIRSAHKTWASVMINSLKRLGITAGSAAGAGASEPRHSA